MSFIFENIFVIVFSLTFFAFIHSFLASNRVKQIIYKKGKGFLPFYRLLYNIISAVILLVIYLNLPPSNVIIYDLPYPYDFVMLTLQTLSLAGLAYTLKYFSAKEFLGLSQVKRWYNKNYDFENLDEESTFRTDGLYSFMRHPVYFFSILFLLFRPYMDLNYFVIFVCFVIYFYTGSIYEEKKLVEKFGDRYIQYQETVPRIVPIKTILRRKSQRISA